MPSWLIEDLGLVAALLGVGTGLLLVVWWRDRQRKYLIAAGVLAALAAVSVALWYFVDTDQRKIKRTIEEMAAGIPHDLNRVFGHVSPTFRHGARDRDDLRRAAVDAVRQRNVTEVRVSNIQVEDVDPAQRRARVNFNFRIQGNWNAGMGYFFCRATFHLDDDRAWRLHEFRVFNPVNVNDPITVPGL